MITHPGDLIQVSLKYADWGRTPESYIYIYTRIYIWRERERETERQSEREREREVRHPACRAKGALDYFVASS